MQRFIPKFSELLKHITSMLKKGSEIKWIDSIINSFESVKKAIMESPTLISLDYRKDFHVFSFSSKHTIVVVLCKQTKKVQNI